MEHPIYEKIERNIGSMKFAVVLIVLLTLSMIVGTFCESYYGANFAGRVIYKTAWFMGIQFLIFLSIFFAMLLRLPPVKRLYGFYTVHVGLILIGCGSFITYHSGIDGSISLTRNTAVRDVVLPENMVTIQFPEGNKSATLELPRGAFASSINKDFNGLRLKEFLPFATSRTKWTKISDPKIEFQSSEYQLFNDKVAQELQFTTYPDQEELPSTLQLGPLNVHYLAPSLKTCFIAESSESIFLWNAEQKSCEMLAPSKTVKIDKTKRGNMTVSINLNGKKLNFFPDFSPWPITSNFEVDTTSPIRIFNKKKFEQGPNLFLFGESLAYFKDGKWSNLELLERQTATLPWMGFKLKLLKHTKEEAPLFIPSYSPPKQKDGEVVEGKNQAISLQYQDKEYWVTDEKPLTLQTSSGPINVFLHNKVLPLPFEFVLTQFKMETDPGTNRPASYESFVQLFTSEGPSSHHIFMNNPLKYANFTFYQSSYFQEESGEMGSVLSVNVDPGRGIKYFGSLLLVLGAILHYFLRLKRAKLE